MRRRKKRFLIRIARFILDCFSLAPSKKSISRKASQQKRPVQICKSSKQKRKQQNKRKIITEFIFQNPRDMQTDKRNMKRGKTDAIKSLNPKIIRYEIVF